MCKKILSFRDLVVRSSALMTPRDAMAHTRMTDYGLRDPARRSPKRSRLPRGMLTAHTAQLQANPSEPGPTRKPDYGLRGAELRSHRQRHGPEEGSCTHKADHAAQNAVRHGKTISRRCCSTRKTRLS
jgi:hypothetical protein